MRVWGEFNWCWGDVWMFVKENKKKGEKSMTEKKR
tara:strand:+ start:684 stop:788 length:105 start_codon:yes stop_codon:yes gene_type:complete